MPGVKIGSITQQVTSALKIILLFTLIIGCFFAQPVKSETLAAVESHMTGGGLLIAFFKAMQLILSTYDGWTSVSFFAEEDNNPGKNIPKSYFIGALTITVLYVLINAAILYVLPINTIAQSPLAASAAAAVAFGSWGFTFINIAAVFIVLSILNAYMMIPSRILFGLSREGFFVPQGMNVNKGGTPYFALLICYGLSFFLIVTNSYEQLFALGAVMLTVVTAFSFASLLQLRKKEPNLYRPFKVWGYPYMTILALVITIVLFIGFAISDYRSLIIVSVIFVSTYPFYKLVTKAYKVKIEDQETLE